MKASPHAGARWPERPRPDLPLLDALRILASVAIVRHHMRGDFLFGVAFGLPLFLVVLLGLATSSSRDETPARFARRRASYFLVPWLRWSILYIVVLAAADVARGRGAWTRLDASMLFAGGEPSLWFLPFAAASMLPARWLADAAARLPPARAALLAAIAAAVATFSASRAMGLALPDMPLRAWLRVAPALLWGIALGQSLRVRTPFDRARVLMPTAICAVATFLAAPITGGPEDLSRRFAVAVLLACVGFGWPVAIPGVVRKASTCTFGVYLVHPFVGKLLGAVFEVRSWPASVHTALAWGLAMLTVLALRKLGLPWRELWPARRREAAELQIARPVRRQAA